MASYAQEEKSVPAVFPVLKAAESGATAWRPDWPADFAPDAFTATGSFRSIEVESGESSYRLRLDSHGRVLEMPLPWADASVSIDRSGAGWIDALSFSDGASYRVLDRIGGFPRILVSPAEGGESILLDGRTDRWSESRYDAEGNPTAYTEYAVEGSVVRRTLAPDPEGAMPQILDLHYDSLGRVSGMEGPDFGFSAAYDHAGRPSYLVAAESGKGEGFTRTYQWDERGLLVRMTQTSPNGDSTDSRYEYVLDGKGNWIERRETRMIPRFGVLVPQIGSIITRKIIYR